MGDHLTFTIVNEFFDKYQRCNIPVELLAIHEDYILMHNHGAGINLMIGRIENGCFIEDATGEWWIQMPISSFTNKRRYLEAGDRSMKVHLKPTVMSWLADFHVDALGCITVLPDGDNLVTIDGILVGSRMKKEEG